MWKVFKCTSHCTSRCQNVCHPHLHGPAWKACNHYIVIYVVIQIQISVTLLAMMVYVTQFSFPSINKICYMCAMKSTCIELIKRCIYLFLSKNVRFAVPWLNLHLVELVCFTHLYISPYSEFSQLAISVHRNIYL